MTQHDPPSLITIIPMSDIGVGLHIQALTCQAVNRVRLRILSTAFYVRTKSLFCVMIKLKRPKTATKSVGCRIRSMRHCRVRRESPSLAMHLRIPVDVALLLIAGYNPAATSDECKRSWMVCCVAALGAFYCNVSLNTEGEMYTAMAVAIGEEPVTCAR